MFTGIVQTTAQVREIRDEGQLRRLTLAVPPANLQALEQVLRELQPVIKTLNQQSNSLIFNASDQPEAEPRKARL